MHLFSCLTGKLNKLTGKLYISQAPAARQRARPPLAAQPPRRRRLSWLVARARGAARRLLVPCDVVRAAWWLAAARAVRTSAHHVCGTTGRRHETARSLITISRILISKRPAANVTTVQYLLLLAGSGVLLPILEVLLFSSF